MKLSRLARPLVLAAVLGALVSWTPRASAWSHQGHILMSRMAALRIINDPQAPEDLKTFLKKHMKYDLAACEKLAKGEIAGANAENYLVGLDGVSTLPDRIQGTDEGRAKLEPFNAPEGKMHFCDQEEFAKDRSYKDDLSNLPKIEDFPRDPKDPRYLASGFLPLRLEDVYGKLVKAIAAKDPPTDDEALLKCVGYVVHYVEDAHQPQHGTVDYKSLSYLAGNVPAVHAVKRKLADGTEITSYEVDRDKGRSINPHGDVEFQLFENDKEPRKTLRAEYWKLLTQDLVALDQAKPAEKSLIETDRFTWTLKTMAHSYPYLPLIGHAAQKAYASGTFEPEPFFTYKEQVGGKEISVLEMIASQNAIAIIETERAIRAAWAEGKK